MPKKKTPAELRAEAQKLLDLAKDEEKLRHEQIGKIVAKHSEEGFSKFDLGSFKSKVDNILNA